MGEAGTTLGVAGMHAVTMTGEMVDLFDSRAQGVARLVAAMGDCLPGRAVRFYGGRGGFLSGSDAVAAPASWWRRPTGWRVAPWSRG